MTDISLRLSEDAVDHNGVARLPPPDYQRGNETEDATIAPWLTVPVCETQFSSIETIFE